jgi:hypothetical protein
MAGKTLHIYQSNGGWAVKKEGKRAETFGTKRDAVAMARDWLRATSKRTSLPSPAEIVDHYTRFQRELPDICADLRLEPGRLTFLDFSKTITDWLRASR